MRVRFPYGSFFCRQKVNHMGIEPTCQVNGSPELQCLEHVLIWCNIPIRTYLGQIRHFLRSGWEGYSTPCKMPLHLGPKMFQRSKGTFLQFQGIHPDEKMFQRIIAFQRCISRILTRQKKGNATLLATHGHSMGPHANYHRAIGQRFSRKVQHTGGYDVIDLVTPIRA